MNKDVIYVEPEDDITDIILKIEKAKEKIVAIVPPKKAGVFRSIVNIKLMTKAALGAEKTIVLVTIDPSIVKLAAATRIPVAKNLQTAPVIPRLDEGDELENESREQLEDDSDDVDSSRDSNNSHDSKSPKHHHDEKNEEEDEEEEEEEEPKKEKDKKPKSKNKFINWIQEHKKLSIFGVIFLVILIGVLVWMFVIAPAVTMKIEIQTTSNDFSKEIKFTTVASEENIEEGIFYMEEKTEKSEESIKFDATGKRNNGNKASGEVTVYKYYPITGAGGTTVISNGITFTINGLSYVSNGSVSLAWSGDLSKTEEECENYGEASLKASGCQVSAHIKVTAAEPGSKYNISASKSGWTTVANVSGVYSDSAMSGGTDDEKTVVQQSDVNNAKNEISTDKEDEYKTKLYEGIDDDKLIIDSSFKQTTSDAVASPSVGEEVSGNTQPTLKVTTTSTVYIIDKSKVEEFIKDKANLDDDQKIYEMDELSVTEFVQTDKSASGKLKTKYYSGPEVTEENVIEKTKGKGLGEAQQELKNINGVISVTIDKSYPWVTSVPGDTSKIKIEFNIKNQGDDSNNKKSDNSSDNDSKDTEESEE